MKNAFKLRLPSGHFARVVYAHQDDDPGRIRARLGLRRRNAALVMHVGAAATEPQVIEQLEPILRDQVEPYVAENGIAVIDGGTVSGLIGSMGRSRRAGHAGFPLIGVAPARKTVLPGSDAVEKRTVLEGHHSHYVLVRGEQDKFGIESEILVGLGQAIARYPVALVMNGGDIVRKEALMQVRTRTPLLVVAGSGRFADELAEADRSGTSDPLLREILESHRVQFCSPETLVSTLSGMVGRKAAR